MISISAGLITAACDVNAMPRPLRSVIPECFYRESKRNSDWTPDENIRG